MIAIDEAWLRAHPLPAHDGEVDKDARGRVLVIGGSREVPGGVLLASVAALRAGAGKLQIATVASVAPGLALAVPEALVIALPETEDGGVGEGAADLLAKRLDRCDAVLIGPGMTGDAGSLAAALAAIQCSAALVLDAAALGCAHAPVAARAGYAVLTPHAGEMASLLGVERDAVLADTDAHARDAAARLDSVVALKGTTTVIATPEGEMLRYSGGSVGLATSGSGDTLAGIVTGLLARGADPLTAAAWAVWLHGEAGAVLARSNGRVGFLARELLAEVPRLMARFD